MKTMWQKRYIFLFNYIDPQHPNRLITDMNDFDMIVINML